MARILHYLDTEQFAGTEQHVLTLLRALTAQGETCGLVCREDNTEFVRRARALPDITVFAAPGLSLGRALGHWTRCVEAWRPDLLHAHNGRTSFQTGWLCRRKQGPGRPCGVMTQHFVAPRHETYRGAKRKVAVLMHRWTNAHLARIIAVSEAARQRALVREHLAPEKVVTIHNGIDPPQADADRARRALQEVGWDGKGPLVVTVARLDAEKGHSYLLGAIPEVIRQVPTARFLWLGSGTLEARLRQEVDRARLQDCVWMLGHRSNASDFVALADLMVLPSTAESFGLVLVEAMLLGMPVIATDCGGPSEIVAPARPQAPYTQAAGWLVPTCDSGALAEAVLEALREPDSTRQIAAQGQARVSAQFTAQRMAARTRQLYHELLDQGARH